MLVLPSMKLLRLDPQTWMLQSKRWTNVRIALIHDVQRNRREFTNFAAGADLVLSEPDGVWKLVESVKNLRSLPTNSRNSLIQVNAVWTTARHFNYDPNHPPPRYQRKNAMAPLATVIGVRLSTVVVGSFAYFLTEGAEI